MTATTPACVSASEAPGNGERAHVVRSATHARPQLRRRELQEHGGEECHEEARAEEEHDEPNNGLAPASTARMEIIDSSITPNMTNPI